MGGLEHWQRRLGVHDIFVSFGQYGHTLITGKFHDGIENGYGIGSVTGFVFDCLPT